MKVSHRLLLTLMPAFVGLLTVVGLAYWGQYQRQAPHFAVVTAVVALGTSVVLALRSARYLAQRIERLAGSEPDQAVDELDSIEKSVIRLQAEATSAREEGARREREAGEERRQLSTLLATAAGTATTAVDEIRLPLHILLENRFGDLNENQERDARRRTGRGRGCDGGASPVAVGRRPGSRNRGAPAGSRPGGRHRAWTAPDPGESR